VAQCIEEKRVRLATVETEGHFVQVGREMLRADAMPRSHDTSLEERECGFDSVRRDHEAVFIPDVLVGAVVDSLALRPLRLRKSGGIENRFVGHDYIYILAHMFAQDFADYCGVCFWDMDEFQVTAR